MPVRLALALFLLCGCQRTGFTFKEARFERARVQRSGAAVDARESLEKVADGLEQSWRFGARPEGVGPVEVRVPIRGVQLERVDARGLHFGTVAYSHGTFIDARGNRTAVSATFRQGAIVLEVPASVVDAAQYPAVLDPVISTELPADDVVPSPAPGAQTLPAVDFDGTSFFATWLDPVAGGTLMATRLTPAGASIDHGGIKLVGPAGAPAVGFDGTNHLLAWEDSRNTGNGYQRDIYAAHVSTSGTVLDTTNLALGHLTGDDTAPKIACGGGACAVVWTNTNTISGNATVAAAIVTASGFTTGLTLSTNTTRAFAPAIAFDGTNFLAVWSDTHNGTFADLYGTRLTQTGSVLDATNLHLLTGTSQRRGESPAIAYDGTNYLVAWGGGATAVQAERVTPAGVVLDATPIAIATSGNDASKAVDFDGANFVVSFVSQVSTQRDARAVRVTSAGAVLDATALQVSTAMSIETATAAAYGGGYSLVAWQDSRGDIYGARVSPQAALPDLNGLLLSEAPNSQAGAAAAYDGTNWFVVWSDTRDGGPAHIFGARFDSNGTIIDNPALPITSGSRIQVSPRVAFDGTQYLVVYADQPALMNDSDIAGTRVTPGGTVLDPSGFVIAAATSYQQVPDVAATDAGFGVVWDDFRTGNRRVFAARVAPDGTVLDPTGIAVGTTFASHNPHVASDGTGFAIAWEDERNAGKNDDIYASHWALDGTLLDGTGLPIASATGFDDMPGLAFGGGHYLVAWRGFNGSSYDLYARTFEADGGMSTTLPLSGAQKDQLYPAIAFDGQNFAAVWQDWRNLINGNVSAFGDLYASRVATSGAILDPQGIPVAVTAGPIESAPSIARGPGRRTLVAYTRDGITGSYTRVRVRLVTLNDPPVAQNFSISTKQDMATPAILPATDVDNDPLTFSVVSMPSNGTLSGTPPNLSYLPNSGYLGPDSFTFKANDGNADSNVATLSITVNPLNSPPVAMAQSVTTPEDAAKPITLAATDPDGDPLTFSIVAQPAKGMLSGAPPNLTYTPNANFNGSDSFTFKANDGKLDSSVAMVSITVTPVNDAPVGTPKSVTLAQDTTVMITLTGTDVEGDPLTFAVATNPAHGTLSGTPPTLTYTPNAGYRGADTFTFTANDGMASSAPATVSINVTAVNHAPTPLPQSLMVQQGHSVGITLTGTDPDGDTLNFALLNPPMQGNLTGTPPNLTYTPPDGFRGVTSFSFQVSDAQLTSGSAAVTITVTNAPPMVTASAMPTAAMTGDTVTFTAVGTDPGNDALTYSWSFADGSSMGSGASVMHSFTAAGTYDVVVTCSDGADSAMATAQVVVTGNTIVPDAGEPDAGATADAGETPDSGQVTPLPDAGSMADAGHDNMTSTGTCGCGSAGFAPGLLALVALVRRRRFPRRAPLR